MTASVLISFFFKCLLNLLCVWILFQKCALDKGEYPENLLVLSCPNKWRPFELFICLDLVLV